MRIIIRGRLGYNTVPAYLGQPVLLTTLAFT